MIGIYNTFIVKNDIKNIKYVICLDDLKVALRYLRYVCKTLEPVDGQWFWLYAYQNGFCNYLEDKFNSDELFRVPCVTNKYRWIHIGKLSHVKHYFIDFCDAKTGNVFTVAVSCEEKKRFDKDLFYNLRYLVKELLTA